jgi:hypothetical protein
MTPVHARRLLKLADFLDRLPHKRFDYSWWTGADWKGKPDLSCGTTACALGWAATMPMARRAGVQLFQQKEDNGYRSSGFAIDGKRAIPAEASARLFGLTSEQHRELFVAADDALGPSPTAKRVAKLIRMRVKVWSSLPSSNAGENENG